MSRKIRSTLLLTGLLSAFIFICIIPHNIDDFRYINDDLIEVPHSSASLEGAQNILVTNLDRIANVSGYGQINIEDVLTIKNMNANPIPAVYIGIENPVELVFFEALGDQRNSLYAERSYMKMNNYEMIAIYFDSPLLPEQTKTIRFIQSYGYQLNYGLYMQGQQLMQRIYFQELLFPLLPYRIEAFKATYNLPSSSTPVSADWGDISGTKMIFQKSDPDLTALNINYLTPFLANLISKGKASPPISFDDKTVTRLEIMDLTRTIFISPWGIIRVTENIEIQNTGSVATNTLKFQIPGPARSVSVSDYLGQILGTSISPGANYTHLEYKELTIDLSKNRVNILPESTFTFIIEYFLPWENYVTTNWLQQSIKINLLTSKSEYLRRSETISLVFDGCYKIDSMTNEPNTIDTETGGIVLVYSFDQVTSLQENYIQITYTIDLFDLLLRPIVFMLIIILIASVFVIFVKSKKRLDIGAVVQKELLPVNEIREFCSLYEEKTALALEIREAEENAKKKKIAKKNYTNILKKNTDKIEEIEEEIVPFKTIVEDTNVTFKDIVKRLELLEAERISVRDSLNLLETRYKQGKLPSRASYFKLTDDFLKRRRRIDRKIDKYIQQLRSYLL